MLNHTLLAVTVTLCTAATLRNNVCTSYLDYLFIDRSPRCFRNEDLFGQTDELILRHIGLCERHVVTTEDGYILTIFRIPRRRPKGVVILQHPVTTDSVVWVGQSNQSFAFVLWRLGYDVWLPNHRGTFFSRRHVRFSAQDEEYWDFSFHEIGLYDYKSFVDFIKERTGSKEIIFVSHSMSTTSSLIYSSLRPEEASQAIKVFISMSPICYLKNVKSPVKYLAYVVPLIKKINRHLKITHLQEYDSAPMRCLRFLMLTFPFKYLLSVVTSFFQGWNPEEFDPLLINLSISQHPRSYSWKLFYHYVQQYLSGGRFQMYDYGRRVNEDLYGEVLPPEYPIEKIIAPTYLVYSDEDSLATPEDVELLYDRLDPKAKVYGKLRVAGINHVDFHYGRSRKWKVFDKIVEFLRRLEV